MKSVGVAWFKEHCVELLAELDSQGLIITKDGKPIAKVTPLEEGPTELQLAVLNGSLRDKVKIYGDIFSTGIRWDAESGHPHSPLHH